MQWSTAPRENASFWRRRNKDKNSIKYSSMRYYKDNGILGREETQDIKKLKTFG